jgi:hypothetical protein
MKLRHLRRAAAFLVLCSAPPTLSHRAAPSPAAEEADAAAQLPAESPAIIVTGERVAPALVVDVERIAARCIACRRAIQRLRAAAAGGRAGPSRGPADPDRGAQSSEWDSGTDYMGVAAGIRRRSIATQQAAGRRAANALDRADAARAAESMVRNLRRYVEPIVERHRLERRAEAVLARGDPDARDRGFPDITDAVIEELDRDHGDVDLLEDAR